MWGGSDEAESIKTIQHAVDLGINLIDTAPVYGFGHSEEIVGKALADGGRRDKAVLATKVALEWVDGNVYRNSTPGRIREEIEDSLRRLRTDRVDLYQVHWPHPLVRIELDAAEQAFGWKLSSDDYAEVDRILRETIKDPVGPEFMAPPSREPVAACI